MDPVDFTKPEAFAKSGAKLADGAAPGVQETSSLLAWLIALRDRLGRRPDGAQGTSTLMPGGAAPTDRRSYEEIARKNAATAAMAGGAASAAPGDAQSAESGDTPQEDAQDPSVILQRHLAQNSMPYRPRRSRLLRWIVLAPLSWLALAGMLAQLEIDEQAYAGAEAKAAPDFVQMISDPAFVARIELLARNSAEMLYWPVLALMGFTLLAGVVRALMPRPKMPGTGQPSQAAPGRLSMLFGAVLSAVKVAPMAATGCAVLGALAVGVALLNDDNHWDALPWVHPPYIEEFLARHPGLRVEQADRRGERVVHDGQGRSISVQSNQLTGAELSFASCPPDLGAAQLGGISPYLGIACSTVAQLRAAQGSQKFYVFHLASGSDSAAVFAHFKRWADEHAGTSGSSSSESRHYLSASRRDEKWRVEMNSSMGGATSIVIRHSP